MMPGGAEGKEVRSAFMDMRMPGIDGLKATRFIREEMKISESELPVIFISAAKLKI